MNEEIKEINEVSQEEILENSELVQEENTSNNENTNDVVTSDTVNKNGETVSTDEFLTIVVDGQERNYLVESYKELKITNLYLNLILIAIVVIFICNKFYYFFKNTFKVRF